jgi:hypothetical protein
MLADEDVNHVLELLDHGVHVKLEGVGHGLGLNSGRSRGLLRALTNFCESI